jgi:hypothetical protein
MPCDGLDHVYRIPKGTPCQCGKNKFGESNNEWERRLASADREGAKAGGGVEPDHARPARRARSADGIRYRLLKRNPDLTKGQHWLAQEALAAAGPCTKQEAADWIGKRPEWRGTVDPLKPTKWYVDELVRGGFAAAVEGDE